MTKEEIEALLRELWGEDLEGIEEIIIEDGKVKEVRK